MHGHMNEKLCDVKQIIELPTRYAVRIEVRNVSQAVPRTTSSDNCLKPKTESTSTVSAVFVPLARYTISRRFPYRLTLSTRKIATFCENKS
jgi:hypothetical protein